MPARQTNISSDEALVARLQRAAFGYFERYVRAGNGLAADTSRAHSPCSIAVVGFALSCYAVAAERGWWPRAVAARRALRTLRTLWEAPQSDAPQSDAPQATGYRGFFYHFLDMGSARRVWNCELSLIDTTLLMAGVLTVAQYFERPAETELRDLAAQLYLRVDWLWAQNGAPTLSQGWHPEGGFLHYGWEGYNEALLLYVLGLGSPTRPLTPSSFAGWTRTYQ